ncbi:uncharacterized protein LOC111465355 [Cucurbita maxima]|uniref:Uncharacterized protein LOC111465355 n=1 Tax=Cucurbita maxima TaxID=3661 RepID=A0A6J1HLQ3_CUCMA|nr:uncharacterized protein LOC111465355 [Cucurbita maxima]
MPPRNQNKLPLRAEHIHGEKPSASRKPQSLDNSPSSTLSLSTMLLGYRNLEKLLKKVSLALQPALVLFSLKHAVLSKQAPLVRRAVWARLTSIRSEYPPQELKSLRDSLAQKGLPLSRSTINGYEASGGEDSDRVPLLNLFIHARLHDETYPIMKGLPGSHSEDGALATYPTLLKCSLLFYCG